MRTMLVALAAVAGTALVASAGDAPDSEVGRAILDLVRSHADGQETWRVDGRKTTIAFDAMTYQIHTPNRVGRMQKAYPELGPRAGGIVVEISAMAGPYGGPMQLPQTLHGAHSPYFPTHCGALVEGGKHYFLCVKVGDRFPEELRDRILDRLRMGALKQPRRIRSVVPVTVNVEPIRGVYAAGGPLLVQVNLRCGLPTPIRFQTYSKEPNAWNGETQLVQLSDIYRNGGKQSLYLSRPKVSVPRGISGIGSHAVQPYTSLRLLIDLAKWKLRDGWLPGAYECMLRLDGIIVDERTKLSVTSQPFTFTVK